MLEEVNFL